MDSQPQTYQQLLAEVYEETAPNLLVYSRQQKEDYSAEAYNEDDFDENDIEEKEDFKKFHGDRNKPAHVIKPKPRNDNDGKASFNIDKNIRTYAINIDGKFRAYSNITDIPLPNCSSLPGDVIPATDSTHFLFKASRAYKNIFSVKVTSFEFLNCFYTFTGLAATVGRNNTHFTLTDTHGGAPPKVIRIPPGNYFIQAGSPEIVNSSNAFDATSATGPTGPTQPVTPVNSNDLLLVINALIKKQRKITDDSYYFGVTPDPDYKDISAEVDASNGFIIFNRKHDTSSGIVLERPFSLTFPTTKDNMYENGIGYNLGFSQLNYASKVNAESKHYATSHSIESETFPDTVQDTYVYLRLNDWYIIRHQNPDQTEFGAFMKIPLTAPKNTIQYMTNTTNTILNEYFFQQPTNFQTIEIELLDSFGKVIDMRGATFSLTLQIQEVLQSDIYEKMLELQ